MGKRTQPLAIENGTWSIITYNNQEISKSSYTMQIDGNRISGKICNSFGGDFTVNDNLLKTSKMMGTLMACSPNVMEIEGGIMTALNSGVIVTMDGKNLTMTSSSGTVFALSPGAKSNSIQRNTLTGSVSYKERIALPAGSLVTVKLQDVSLADAQATTIGEYNLLTKGENVPLDFALNYDPALIKPGHRYALRATISMNEKLRWTTTENYPALGPQDQTTNIMLMVNQVN